ncbi:TonB-dependent siderophore receptor [Herbaspirillum sp. LeCh32-8]|uniref:TonB-dependent siderophore receptor n=1 Tax=Herbaspirillum sp. LeCh32-8 TaxID=2821356 RepID=UPI001AE6857B|nr:TonB-dependent siderophore receptor [Herbaspirillum sp. LeCh32-8]MBP0597874.1 TonB-dependent siderophore receptor [Herbaspirillum sp. LeCh32-8]
MSIRYQAPAASAATICASSAVPVPRPLAHAVAGALLVLAFGLPAAQPAWAQASTGSAAAHAYRIPAGPLDATLDRFAREARITLAYDAASLRGLQSAGLNGSYTVDAALAALLSGSGMSAVRLAEGDYTVRAGGVTPAAAPASTSLPTVIVKDRAEAETALTPVVGNVARISRVGTKTDTSLKETPQAISVITRDQLDAQGVESLAEGLRYTPGVVTQYGNTDLRYDWLTVRGFVPGRYLDGLRLPFGSRGYAQPRIEPFGLERIEVLKGPSSLLYGQAAPGGLVNMVSKRPTTETVREVELQYGNNNRKQLAVDLGGQFDEHSDLSYRLVALGRKSDTSYDYVSEERTYFAPSLTWRPNASTQFTLLAQYQKIDSKGGGGAPVLPANGTLYTSVYPALSRSTFAGEPNYDRFSNEQYFVGYEFEHRFNDDWSVRQNLRVGEVNTETRRVQAFCLSAASCNPSSLQRYAWAFPETSRMWTIDNQLQGKFSLGATRHTLLLGADYSSESSHYEESSLSVLAGSFNAYAPVYGRYSGTVPPVATRIQQDRDQFGLYLQDQIRLDRWTLVAGGRYDWADTDTLTTTSTTRTPVRQRDSAFTGRLGLLYSFDNGITPYVSYSTSFQPTIGVSRTSDPFKPTKGKQTEAGVKYQPDGSRTMVTLSTYEMTQQNVTTPDPLNTNFSVQTGEVRVRGVELEGKVQIDKGLDLIASYAYTDSKIMKANTSGGVNTTGNRLAFVPQNQASAWLDYTVQDAALAGLGGGFGARYLGESFGDNANLYHTPGVTLFDAALRYDFGKTNAQLKGLRIALNASNIFNKTYVAACLSAAGCYYGDGRSVYLTLKYGW